MSARCDDPTLEVLYLLLTSDRFMSTKEIVKATQCERRTVYKVIDRFECAGFVTEKTFKYREGNFYSVRLREEEQNDKT